MRSKLAIGATLAAAAVILSFWYVRLGPKLLDTDTILISDFANSTGDPVFDGSLREALTVTLGESPWLNIVSEEKADEALRSLGRSADDPLTPELSG